MLSVPLKRRRTSNKQPAKRYAFDDAWAEQEYGNTNQESREAAIKAFLDILLREYALLQQRDSIVEKEKNSPDARLFSTVLYT